MIEALSEIANWWRGKRPSLGESIREERRVAKLAELRDRSISDF